MAAAMRRNGGHSHHHSLFFLIMSLLSPSSSSFSLLLGRQTHHYHRHISTTARSAAASTNDVFNLHHPNIITLEQCHHPYNTKLFDFYRTNFHERRNKKIVPSLPRKQHHDDDDVNGNNNIMNDDAIYTLTSQHDHQQQGDNNIVAALRLTKSKNDNQYTFLRSMCVSRDHRRQGLAKRLLTDALRAFRAHYHCCYCFASPDLERFYQKLGFGLVYEYSSSGIDAKAVDRVPKWMIHSFESMVKRNQHKELRLYVRYYHCIQSSSSSSTITTSASQSNQKKNSTQIVLLQHHTEQSKNTATGWLLNDTLYAHKFGANNITSNNTTNDNFLNSSPNDDLNSSPNDDTMKLLVQDHVKVSIWTWRGTNDVAMIQEQIGRLVQDENRMVYLLWTGGATTTTTTEKMITTEQTTNNNEKKSAETYIIIDGTWQQTKKMYRRIPKLWSLPRISFSGDVVPPSKYVLRGDYSGWRERFGGTTTKKDVDDDGGNGRDCLLCTAEVAAAVMDRCGHEDCANVIRSRLDVFQSTFSHNNDNY